MVYRRFITACWIIFFLYWAIKARSAKVTVERQSRAGILAHRVPLLVGYLLLLWSRLPDPWSLEVIPNATILKPLGAAICALGLLAAIWSRKTLAGNWSRTVVFKQSQELVERGPYRFVRHPIYTSLLLMYLGTAIAANRLGSLVGLLFYFAGYWIKLRQEEKLLRRHFPNEYPAYQARVKALVPFVF